MPGSSFGAGLVGGRLGVGTANIRPSQPSDGLAEEEERSVKPGGEEALGAALTSFQADENSQKPASNGGQLVSQ